MQINQSPRFIKSFMIGLVASSTGAFVALPSVAMPEPDENVTATEVIEDTAADSIDELPTPTAEETLPSPEETLEAAETPDAADLEAEADVDLELTEETEAADAVAEESAEETVEADAEVVDETVEADAEMTEETVEADAEMTDEAVEADAGEEINTEEFTIAELTDNSESFSILAQALAAADLTTVLADEGPYTIFAPTDEAFEALPEGTIEQLLAPENKNILIQVLSYHVVPGELMSTDLASGNLATVQGSEVMLDVEADGLTTINNATVFLPDVKASNGVIHAIDSVIAPPLPEPEAGVEDPAAEPVQ